MSLIKAYQDRRDREDYRFGLIAATLINAQGGWKEAGAKAEDPGRPATPADFFPNLPQPREHKPRTQSAEAMLEVMRGYKNHQRAEDPPGDDTLA